MTIRNFSFSVRNLSPRSDTITIYRSTADTSVPATLTQAQRDNLSFNFSTRVLTGLPSGWQQAPVEVDVTTTTSLFYSYDIAVSEASYSGTQTFTNLGSPTGRISFGNDIQSDNFVAGSTGWRIERDNGDAEFSSVNVRGASTVQSSTIGGDAFVQWSTQFSDNGRLNGQLGGAIFSGQGTASVTNTEILRFNVERGTYTITDGAFIIDARLLTGTAAQFSDFTDSTLSYTAVSYTHLTLPTIYSV